MAFNYAGLEQTADTLVDKFGAAMTLTRTTEGAGADPFDPVRTETDYAVNGVRLNFSDREIDGTAVQHQDYKILLAAKDLTVVPEPDDVIADGSSEVTVVGVRRIHPGDTDLAYMCHVRK